MNKLNLIKSKLMLIDLIEESKYEKTQSFHFIEASYLEAFQLSEQNIPDKTK